MKKLLCLFVIALLVLTVFVSCGDTETTGAETTTTEPVGDVTTGGGDTVTTKDQDPAGNTTKPATSPIDPTPTEIPEIDENSIDLFTVTENFVRNIKIEDTHSALSNHPALVFSLDGNKEIYHDILGTAYDDTYWYNINYYWVLKINGEEFIPDRFTVYVTDDYGYFRCDLGAKENYDYVKNCFEYNIELLIIDVDTWTVKYYADFAESYGPLKHQTGYAEAENKPDDVAPVKGVTCISGPDYGKGEGAQKAFDNDYRSKICTTDNDTPIVVFLGGEKTLRGISLVNANDSYGTRRVVVSFEVWVSEDGVNWGTAPAWSCSGTHEDRAGIDENYLEIYRDFGKSITGTYVKIVIHNENERYQFCEAVLYQAYDPNAKPETLLPLEDDSINLFNETNLANLAIEDKHGFNGNNPAFVFQMTNNETVYKDILGSEYTSTEDWKNSKYKWVLSVNGERYEPTKFSIFTVGYDGYFRCDLGPVSNYTYTNGKCFFIIDLYIVDAAIGKVVYYALFSEERGALLHERKTLQDSGMIEAADKPEGVTAIEGVTAVSGPDAGKKEGFEKAFDGMLNTKICTEDNDTPIVVNLGGEKQLKGISFVNANDNSGYKSRTVVSFEVWVSSDGENWGDAPAWSTDGAGVKKEEISDNYLEIYRGFDTPITASYVKLVINNGERYQMSEILFYQ